MEFWLEEKVRILASELKYARSIDTYLVKMSSLIYELEDQCLGDTKCVVDLFRKVLEHPALSREISTLACHIDEVLHVVQENPRFRNLRNYLSVVEDVLRKTTCVSEKELVVTREPTFRVEREEYRALERPVITAIKQKLPLKLLLKICAVVAAVLILLGVILIITSK
ncbi:MAG: hypothetical protein LM555_02740 [Desulfurococcaceae archaeon]|nr:hypothetical protein [Desulfurococcaceae archaeon]